MYDMRHYSTEHKCLIFSRISPVFCFVFLLLLFLTQLCSITTDGERHFAAHAAVCPALPGPPWDAAAGVPPVCLWRAPGEADGESGCYCREQGWRQVCHGLLLICTAAVLWWCQSSIEEILSLYCRYGKLEELLEKSFPLVKMPSIQPVVMQVLKHLPKASVFWTTPFSRKLYSNI